MQTKLLKITIVKKAVVSVVRKLDDFKCEYFFKSFIYSPTDAPVSCLTKQH